MINVNEDTPNFEELNEAVWRRPLTKEEQARLRRHLAVRPEECAQWESEIVLTRTLHRLSAAPVSSNFTALVMQAVRPVPTRAGWWQQLDLASWFPAGWRPRLAMGAAMVCLSLLTAHEYQAAQRQKEARELASVSTLATLQPVGWMKDFHTIQGMGRVQLADDDLLKVLQ